MQHDSKTEHVNGSSTTGSSKLTSVWINGPCFIGANDPCLEALFSQHENDHFLYKEKWT